MGLASQSELFKAEDKSPESTGWTMRRIFSPKTELAPIVNSFTNPLETILGFVIFILGVATVMDKPTSKLAVFGVLLLLEVSFERLFKSKAQPIVDTKKPKKQKQVV